MGLVIIRDKRAGMRTVTVLLLLFSVVAASEFLDDRARYLPLPSKLEKDDPEIDMDALQMIRCWGYPAEPVEVTTSDGYILQMHRIPYGKSGPATDGQCRPPVFLQHGLLADATCWTVNLPDESPAYMLADAGFHVWMGNFRGTDYGRNHTHLDPDKEEFWQFSWDEMGQIDLEAMIDKVLEVTNQTSLYYIGHSQGTLTMFSKLSVADATYANKIKKFFALAPVGTVKHIKGLMKTLEEILLPALDTFYELFGSGEFLPHSWIMELIAKWVCEGHEGNDLCSNLIFQLCGPESSQFNETRAPVYIAHNPGGTSTNNMLHWMQMVDKGTVSRFDYMSDEANQKQYGQPTPPAYDFSTIKTDMYLYCWQHAKFKSDDDWLADPEDLNEYLFKALNSNYVKGNFHLEHFNHLDFIWGLNSMKEINPIIDIITQDLGGKVQCGAKP